MVMILSGRISMLYSVLERETLTEQEQDGKYVALARALALLQTGTPSDTPSSFIVRLAERPGKPQYAVVYTKISKLKWSINVSLASKSFPPLPESFGGT